MSRSGFTPLDSNALDVVPAINRAVFRLEALTVGKVVRDDLTSPPSSPAEDSLYIVASPATWTGAIAGDVAHFYAGSWHYYRPGTGDAGKWRLDVSLPTAITVEWDGTTWTPVPGGTESKITKAVTTTANSLSIDVSTPIDFTSVVVDTMGAWSSVNPSRLTAPTDAIYMVSGNVGMVTSVTAYQLEVSLSLNEAAICSVKTEVPANGEGFRLNPTALIPMAAGDYVQLRVTQNLANGFDTSASENWLSLVQV